MADPKPKRRKPKSAGIPLRWTEADLLIQATPTALDMADAAALWRQYAPAWARALFDTAPDRG
jgi:hypothetical protein